MLAAYLTGSNAALVLFEDADNLLLTEPSFHERILFLYRSNSLNFWCIFQGLCQILTKSKNGLLNDLLSGNQSLPRRGLDFRMGFAKIV